MKAPQPGCELVVENGKPVCIIDPEFRDLLDPLSPKELAQLEANLVADGRVIDPIAIWAEEDILLDGHHRLPIAIRRDINYKFVRMNFKTRDEALNWVIDHQRGRRSLSEAADKKLTEWRRDRVAKATAEGKSNRQIAADEKVSEKTVRKDQKARGADRSAPVKGKDKKVYKSRADRVGQAPPKPFEVKGREPGDGRLEEAQAKEDRTAPKQGKALFDWAFFNRNFAHVASGVAIMGKAYKAHTSPQCKALAKGLVDWKKELMTWYKTISKQKAPMEPHERGRKGKK